MTSRRWRAAPTQRAEARPPRLDHVIVNVSDVAKRAASVPTVRSASLASAALPLIMLAGCGGSDEPDATPPTTAAVTMATAAPASSPTPTTTPEDDLKKSISDYSMAYLTGDGATTYDLLTKRCQGVLPLSECASLTEQAKDLYGDVKIESVDVKVDGDKATSTYTYAVPAINQTDELWLIERSGWKNDDC